MLGCLSAWELYGNLTKTMYIRQPKRYEHTRRGLPPEEEHLRVKAVWMNLEPDTVRSRGNKQVFILLYVDNMRIFCETESEYEAILQALSK